VWVVALILPVLAVVSGSVNYMMNRSQLSHGWDSLTSQVFIFYGMFFCSLGVALLASTAWTSLIGRRIHVLPFFEPSDRYRTPPTSR